MRKKSKLPILLAALLFGLAAAAEIAGSRNAAVWEDVPQIGGLETAPYAPTTS
jgi:hypothetical protein